MCDVCTGNGDTQRPRAMHLLHGRDSALEEPGLSFMCVECRRIIQDHTTASVPQANPHNSNLKYET